MSKFDIFSKPSPIDEITNMSHTIFFINPIGKQISLHISHYGHYEHRTLDIPFWQFAEKFPTMLGTLFRKYSPQEIWLIAGPGPFTQMRIITLALNALKYSFPEIIFRSAHFFDILPLDAETRGILEANNREYLITWPKGEHFISKDALPPGKYIGHISAWFHQTESQYIPYTEDFPAIVSYFQKTEIIPRFSPLYIKPAHITCPTS